MLYKNNEEKGCLFYILFWPIDIWLSTLYYNSIGADSFNWLFLDYLVVIPFISRIISRIITGGIGLVLEYLIGIPQRAKERKIMETKKAFAEKQKSFILAEKYLNNNQIDISGNINTNDFKKALDNIRDEIKNNKEMYKYNSLTLDEQNEYLEKAPLLMIETIKKICKKLIDEINNEQNTDFKYYCNDEKIIEYKNYKINKLQKIIDFGVDDDYESLKTINIMFIDFILTHLNTYGIFYNSFFELYSLQIKLTINNDCLYINTRDSNNTYFPYYASDKECEEKCSDIKLSLDEFEYNFLLNNLNTDYYKNLKSAFSDPSLNICNIVYKLNEKLDNEAYFMIYIKGLIIHYLYNKERKLLTNYCREIFNIDNVWTLFDELDKDRGIIFSGVAGEKMVEEEFDIYKDELEYFSNIRFEDDNLSVETDGLIVSDRGIFSIEIKNFKFPKIKISKDGQWKKCYYGAGGTLEEEVMKDVGSQMNRHIIITERLFNRHLKEQNIKDKIEIKPMIIIANNQIEIENDSDMVIVRSSQIYNNFKKSDCNYSKKAISEIKKYIKDNKLSAKKYDIINYEKTFENITKSLLENRNKNVELFNEILRVLNEDLPKDLEGNMNDNN